jgi:hypothetical protein
VSLNDKQNGIVMVGYGIHGVRGTLVLVVLGHSESRRACVDDIWHMRKARNKTQKRREGREKEDVGSLRRSGLRHLLSPRRWSRTRSKSDFRFGQDNTMPRAPTFARRDEVRVVSESGSGKTHDHKIKRNEDKTLSPIGLGICRNIVDKEASADEKDDFEKILAVKVSFPVLNEATTLFFTEEQGHGLLHPPTK